MTDLYSFSETLRKRAHWTHEIIHKGVFLQLGIMEETITDMHLLSIAEEFNGYVITKKFTRKEEGARSGADWLWLIGEPGSWLPLLVQAKIINPKTGNCQRLDNNGGEQRKRLLLYARQHSLVPVYCIYSYIPSSLTLPTYFKQYNQQKEDWACCFISPKTVRLLSSQGKKHQNEILSFGIPWMYPFIQASTDTSSTGQAIANAIISFRNSSKIKMLSENIKDKNNLNPLVKRTNWEDFDTSKAVKKEIPSFVCKMLKEFYYKPDVPLGGVSVLSTVPIKDVPELNYNRHK